MFEDQRDSTVSRNLALYAVDPSIPSIWLPKRATRECRITLEQHQVWSWKDSASVKVLVNFSPQHQRQP